MLPSEDIDERKRRAICLDCVDEDFLQDEIQAKGKRRKCFYCKGIRRALELEIIAEYVERAFSEHYERSPSEPDGFEYAMLKDKEIDYDWSREGEETIYAIMNAAQIPLGAAEDIQKLLEDKHSDFEAAAIGEEQEFDSDAYYAEKGSDDSDWQAQWRTFERTLRSNARFFNQAGAEYLASVFQDIETLKTRNGRRIVVDAGPGTPITGFYRARVFHTPDKVEEALIDPAKNVGPPPSAYARAGRMNAHGISVFYGAEKPGVALAEIRPPVGSWAIVARFEIIRPIRLLDLTALVDIVTSGSVFDPEFKNVLGRAKFLRSLCQRLTVPVMPDDEPFEYLITQAVADFLATDSRIRIDGILFPSVQVAGSAGNVVLFHKSSSVQPIELPKGTKVTAHAGYTTEDGWEYDFNVWEEVPEPVPVEKKKPLPGFESLFDFPEFPPWSPRAKPERRDTLKVDLEAVSVHEIRAVEFQTNDFPVARHRHKAIERPDF